jgi:hypothetical protein
MLTKAGKLKSRWSLDTKLELLDGQSCRKATLSRVADFRNLFAFKVSNGIVTCRGQGPSAWTTHRGVLGDAEIIGHLLANRIPARDPVWFGARSFQTSLFICLDVDADRSPQQILAKKYPEWEQMPDDLYAIELNKIASHLARQTPRPSFADRCTLVERAFRRMGINPDNPTSVLIQPTPSGGRHYYVFFDAPYLLSQYHQLLQAAKLQHVPGEIEFYPSTKHGLRLPFGYIPGKTHDPQAWIQFIDDYRNGKIIRHSLADCHDSLEKHTEIQSRRIQSVKESRPGSPPGITHQKVNSPSTPKSAEPTRDPNQGADAESRYRSLLEEIRCSTDVEELMSLGILLPGTRTKVLNHLAAHLIWFKHLSAADAASFLIDWAMSPRHASKDITADLTDGTSVVAKHIQTMCRWYESNKQTSDIPVNAYTAAEFAPQELNAIRYRLADLCPDARANQVRFLLHFLRFAKHHGSADSNGTGWLASPAIRQIIRRWPGCHHMNYATRIRHAVSGGCMEVVKDAWHRPNGPGRARTYRLSVPVVPEGQWVMTYEAAFDFLMHEDPHSPTSDPSTTQPSRKEEETSHADYPDRPDAGNNTNSSRGALPTSLSSPCAGTGLDSSPRQRHPQPYAAPRLHRRDSQGVRTTAALAFQARPLCASTKRVQPAYLHDAVFR